MKSISKYQWLFYAQVLLIAYMLLVRLMLVFSYNVDADGAEFAFMHHVQQLLIGRDLYPDPYVYPYSFVIYSPLYLYVVYFIAKINSLNYINDIHEIYVIGRSVSYICVLGSIYIVDCLIKKETTSKTIRLSAIFVFLCIISGHAFVFRSDGMKVFFFLAFLNSYIDYFFYSKNKMSLLLLLLFAILAFLAKQDVIIYILLFQCIYVVFERSRKAFQVLLLSAFFFIITSFLLKSIFGKFCFENLVLFNLQVISEVKSSYNLLVVLFNLCRLLPVCLYLMYVLYQYRNEHNTFVKALLTSSLIAFVLSNFFLFRPGSYLNYTYEATILLMFTLFIVFRRYSNPFLLFTLLYFGLYFLSNLVIKNYVYFPEKEKKYKLEYSEYFSLRDQLLPRLSNNESLFTPELMLSIFFADKNVIYGQEFHLDNLIYIHLGLKSDSKLLFNSSKEYDKNFENGNVKYILSFDKNETKEVMQQNFKHYQLLQKVERFLLYEYVK